MIDTIVSVGGYTHPLFRKPETGEPSSDDSRPLPGQGVLLLMGGLLEQSGALDHAIALLELKDVRFHRMVRAGARISVLMVPLAASETSSGKTIQNFRWTVFDEQDTPVLEAHAVMLMNKREEGVGTS